ncbi:MAG TPA: galactose-1-phosphate uridylyltransferase [Sediminispirochaeta sp.]|nr:galactose-1-phosphate uridylyltransferase [Sediminispirochaeta sp.]
MNLQEDPHRRYPPLAGEWVLVSPHRAKRPWQGRTEHSTAELGPSYDPSCYLCPGNCRAGGIKNPDYQETFVFLNDFSALLPDVAGGKIDEGGLFRAKSERGICKVVCFSPRHDLTIALMDVSAIRGVVDVWEKEYRLLGEESYINYVQIFKNRGLMMGCSNPHPHGQIWSTETVPELPSKEKEMQGDYLSKKGSCLLCDYLKEEESRGERVVISNDSFTALVPFWAVWPFEVLVLPRRHVSSIAELGDSEKNDLASLIKRLGTRFDNLFFTHFPYSMGLHQKPTEEKVVRIFSEAFGTTVEVELSSLEARDGETGSSSVLGEGNCRLLSSKRIQYRGIFSLREQRGGDGLRSQLLRFF